MIGLARTIGRHRGGKRDARDNGEHTKDWITAVRLVLTVWEIVRDLFDRGHGPWPLL